jgi:hypothetical protein
LEIIYSPVTFYLARKEGRKIWVPLNALSVREHRPSHLPSPFPLDNSTTPNSAIGEPRGVRLPTKEDEVELGRGGSGRVEGVLKNM